MNSIFVSLKKLKKNIDLSCCLNFMIQNLGSILGNLFLFEYENLGMLVWFLSQRDLPKVSSKRHSFISAAKVLTMIISYYRKITIVDA